MWDIIWLGIEVIIIVLLMLECWLLWFFAKEHSYFLELIKIYLLEIKSKMKKDTHD